MKVRLATTLLGGVALLCASGSAYAELQGRDLDGDATTSEAYYDTVLDITWFWDPLVIPQSNDPTVYEAAKAAVEAFEFGGFDDWRMPRTVPADRVAWRQGGCGRNEYEDIGFAVRHVGNELTYNWFVNLGNDQFVIPNPDPLSPHPCIVNPDWVDEQNNISPFKTIDWGNHFFIEVVPGFGDGSYFSDFVNSHVFVLDPDISYIDIAGFNYGARAWPVRDGDVTLEGNIAALLRKTENVGPGASLYNKVALFSVYFGAGDTEAACGMLTDLLREVDAQAGKKHLTTQEAEGIVASTERVMLGVGCY